MTTVTAINRIGGSLAHGNTTPVQQSLRRWNTGLFVSALLGAVSGLVGLAIGFLTLLDLVVSSTTLYTIGTVLIGTSFIMFGLVAHCIDKADVADKTMRLGYCRHHGLKDEDCDAVKLSK